VHLTRTSKAAQLVDALRIKRLIEREDGQDLIEYALVFAALAFATIASMSALASAVGTALINVGMVLTSAV
jgi:Flp pilus assembly pilin Flp